MSSQWLYKMKMKFYVHAQRATFRCIKFVCMYNSNFNSYSILHVRFAYRQIYCNIFYLLKIYRFRSDDFGLLWNVHVYHSILCFQWNEHDNLIKLRVQGIEQKQQKSIDILMWTKKEMKRKKKKKRNETKKNQWRYVC